MSPIILIMFILYQGHAVDYGTEFVTAFPENLAFYYPSQLYLKLKITTFIDGTTVTVINAGTNVNQTNITNPQVFIVNISNAEVNELGVSDNVIRITSDKIITVLSISMRGDSIQTNMVPPTTSLGTEYLVPSPNYTQIVESLNSSYSNSASDVIDFSYRLIIINAEADNNSITLTQKSSGEDDFILLGPFEMIQLPNNSFGLQVSSTKKVAVILTNPCVDTRNCKCNMVTNQLRPKQLLGNEFIVPNIFGTQPSSSGTLPPLSSLSFVYVTSDQSVILTSGSVQETVSPGSVKLLPFYPAQANGSPFLKTSVPSSIRIMLPGLMIDLLPNNMFSGCYLVHQNSQNPIKALVIVATSAKNNVHQDSSVLSSNSWTDLNSPGFSWTYVTLTNCMSCVIWHPTSPIAVYVFENVSSLIGRPAISLNDEPDPNGCVVSPITFELVNMTLSWQESRAQCFSKGLVLASPNINYTQNKLVRSLNSMKVEGNVWLGLRRSLIDSQWYWQSDGSFAFTNWDNNQPSSGLCVSVRMEPNGNFTWSSMRCCSQIKALCSTKLEILSVVSDRTATVF